MVAGFYENLFDDLNLLVCLFFLFDGVDVIIVEVGDNCCLWYGYDVGLFWQDCFYVEELVWENGFVFVVFDEGLNGNQVGCWIDVRIFVDDVVFEGQICFGYIDMNFLVQFDFVGVLFRYCKVDFYG